MTRRFEVMAQAVRRLELSFLCISPEMHRTTSFSRFEMSAIVVPGSPARAEPALQPKAASAWRALEAIAAIPSAAAVSPPLEAPVSAESAAMACLPRADRQPPPLLAAASAYLV